MLRRWQLGMRTALGPGVEAPARNATRAAQQLLRRELAAFRPDVVHTHAAKAGALGRRAAARAAPDARRVHTFHGHVLEGYFPGPVSAAMRGVEARLARDTHGILAVSEATRDDLVRLGVTAAERVEVSGDWSGAAFPLVAAALLGRSVALRGLRPDSPQGDRAILDFLARFGLRHRWQRSHPGAGLWL